MYISPYLASRRKLSSDATLNASIAIVGQCKGFDPRSYTKSMEHLQRFMYNYSNTYTHGAAAIHRMRRNRHKAIHYLRRIPFRLHNDADLEHALREAIDSIDTLLENYISEASDRKGMYYFPSMA